MNNSLLSLELVIDKSSKAKVKHIIEKYHSYVASNSSVGRRIDWLIYHKDYTNILGVELGPLQPISGYVKSDGTFVNSYLRTTADGSLLNNLRPKI